MKMKRSLIITALLGITIVIGSCKKNITLSPSNGVEVENYFVNQKDITASLAGIYSAFQEEMTGDGSGKDEGYGGRYHYWGEVRSDNFFVSTFSTTSVLELGTNGISFTNNTADWAGLYKVIARANLGLQKYQQVSQTDLNVTQTFINNSLAQAYAMRAESYFYIVRVWGDAPMWTEPYLDILQPAAKPQTKALTLIDSLIIPDLLKANSLIQKQQTANVYSINEGAISAILADVYMWRAGLPGVGSTADYQNAITWYTNLFNTKNGLGNKYAGTSATNLETQANWKNAFLTPASSIEDIWSIYWDYNANGCACIPISVQLTNNPVSVDINFQTRWKAFFKTDTRVQKTIDTVAGLNHQNLVYKYLPLTPNATTNTPGITPSATTLNYNVFLPMYRLSDAYLSLAEAYANTGNLPKALTYLNYVYGRARIAPAALAITAAQVPDATTMEDAILQERQYELFGEGKRWFDLVRTGRVKQVMDPLLNVRNATSSPGPNGSTILTPVTTGFTGAPQRYYWPVSQNALNANKLLHQNAGY